MSTVNGENVPILRFPEFTGAWEATRIGDLGTFVYGKSAPKFSLVQSGGTPCVRYGELYRVYGTKITEAVSQTSVPAKRLRFSNGGEILIPRVGEDPMDFAANCSFLPLSNIAIGEMISAFSTDENPVFYTHYFRSLRKQFGRLVEGGNVSNLYYSYLEDVAVGKPSRAEQKKIASFLDSVDEKIEALETKEQLLKVFKKGCVQKLLTGQLRFKNDSGRHFPDWRDGQLSDFCDVLSGYPVPGEEISEQPDGLPLMRGINITEGSVRHSPDIDRYFRREITGLENYLLEEGDIVIGMDGSKVGKNVAVVSKKDAGSFLIQRVARLRGNSKNKIAFAYHFIFSSLFHRYVDRINTSSGIPHISLKQIREFQIPLPDPLEQQKIADFLTSIDDRIALIGDQIEQIRKFKKGLLQQMFV